MLAMMIDLETLALTQDATIVSIGAVTTNLALEEWNSIEGSFYYRLNLNQSRLIDPDTLMWHMQQEEAVIKDTFRQDNRTSLHDALMDLAIDINTFKPETIWSKGADFDIKILENAYKQLKIEIPWTYRQPRCFRTLEAIAKDWSISPAPVAQLMKHTALDDAFAQTKILHAIWRKGAVRHGN